MARLVVMLPVAALLCNPSPAWAQSLGAASSFAVLGGSAVTAAGGGAIITGDVGVSPGTSITGFPPAIVVPPYAIHNNDGPAIAAQGSVTTLYNSLLAGACTPLASDQLNLQTLGPGCHSGGALDLASGGILTLSGSGIYIFRASSSLVANVGSNVLLNGVNPCNVFWQVTSSATLNGITFPGNVVALASVTLGTGATLIGRALAKAAVTMAGGNTVGFGGCSGGQPAPAPAPGPGPTPVPTLSEWAMIVLAALLALVGFAALRRRASA